MKEVIEQIGSMDPQELRQLMKAVEQRFSSVYPEWEVLYIALRKDPALRREEVANVLKFFRNQT